MPESTFVTLEQATAEMLRWFIYKSGLEPDTEEGGILRTLFEAVGFEIEQRSFAFDQALQEAILEAAYSAFALSFDTPKTATTTLRFARSAPAAEAYLIPAGTRAQTATNQLYETTEDRTLTVGATYVDAPARALEPGSVGNAPADSITLLVTALPGIETVTNPLPAAGGQDAERLERRQTKLAEYLASLLKGTPLAVRLAALAVQTPSGERAEQVAVADAYTDPQIPVGLGRIYLYRKGGVSAALLAQVKSVLESDQRPIGTVIEVLPVSSVSQDVVLQVIGADAAALGKVQTALSGFFDALAIGEDLDRNRLIAALKDADPSIYTVSLSVPASNVPAANYSKLELGTANLSFTLGGPA